MHEIRYDWIAISHTYGICANENQKEKKSHTFNNIAEQESQNPRILLM